MEKSNLIQELERMYVRFTELQVQIADPAIMKHPNYHTYLKEFGSLQKIMTPYQELRQIQRRISEDLEMLDDPANDEELREVAREEIAALESETSKVMERIKDEIYLEEGQSDKVILEIRAGTGGDEASLFAADLFRMYMAYCERRRWKTEMMDSRVTDVKGYRNVIFSISGKGAYNALQYESGGHRVQRVPETEGSGRIHTSAATVAVMPEAEDVEVNFGPKDLEIETIHASGPGGQNVNKVETAVRITHIPSGTVVVCQEGKSQHSNKERAMRVLKTRVFQQMKEKADRERGDLRRSLIGSGDRNERIRTYNFPQNRVTDHRINYSVFDIESFMVGMIDDMIAHLQAYFKERFFEEYVGSR